MPCYWSTAGTGRSQRYWFLQQSILSILIFKYKHWFLQTAPHPFFCLAGKYCVIPLFAHIFFFFIVHNHHFQIKVIFSREIIFDYAVYISISLPYRKFNFPVNPHVCLMVGRLVCFLKGRKVRLIHVISEHLFFFCIYSSANLIHDL